MKECEECNGDGELEFESFPLNLDCGSCGGTGEAYTENKDVKKIIIKWRCNYCESVQSSDSSKTHEMDFCECGASGLDLEEHYMRAFGDVEEMERTDETTD